MKVTLSLAIASLLVSSACSRSNNLFLGRVETRLGSHQIVVTDCYRTSVPPAEIEEAGVHYSPCRDADVVIRNEELVVNRVPYGRLRPDDTILVEHGVVSVNGHRR